jgi:ribonuclease P protein component
MFPKNRRIPRKMFPFLNGGKTHKNNIFYLKFVLKPESQSRFYFSVSKKISKSAVARNRIRRAGYQLLQKYLPELKPNILALFSFKMMPKNDDDMAKSLGLILKESKLIK